MKKYKWILGLLIMVFYGCSSDDEEVAQLSFTYSNMATLLGKSGNYIKQASPGTFYQYTEYTDYSYYAYIFDEITVLGNLYITYHMVNDACDDIMMFTESEELAKAQQLMQIATNEMGEAGLYLLDYVADSILYRATFANYSSLWSFITDNGYTVDDIYQLYSLYVFSNYSIYAGGFWDNDAFWPFAEISIGKKKSTSPVLPFRTQKGDLNRFRLYRGYGR
jgi:hypothetical protein